MSVMKSGGVEAFLRKPDASIAALLIYGDEAEAVREIAARAVKRIAGSLDDPFSVVTLQDGDLSQDPARLADEVKSLSMFGGNRAIWIKNADQAFFKAVTPVLEGKVSGNFIVAEAGPLAKTSQLRSAFEVSPRAYIVPLYEADQGEISGLVEQLLSKDSLRIEPDAIQRFIELVGTSRALVQREAEKLALYCMGGQTVSTADVEAVCGNDTAADPQVLADKIFEGDLEAADRLFQSLLQSGIDAGRLVSTVHFHAMRLQDFRIAMERGMSADQAMRSARPPIFFKRQQSMQMQLRAWDLADLVRAGNTLGTAVQHVRQNAELGQAIANRCLLSMARQAASKSRHGR
jgi:DNA polymerase III subunit delta